MAALQNQVIGYVANLPADLSDKRTQERLSPSAVKGFFEVVRLWKIRDESARELLGGVSNGTFYKLKKGQVSRLDVDKLTRISLVVGIFKALNILYSQRLADAWISRPNTNPMFRGDTPLAYMIKGAVPGMMRVRQLLDARRGGR
jgi:uncharacterized protein (DUF2384 family)